MDYNKNKLLGQFIELTQLYDVTLTQVLEDADKLHEAGFETNELINELKGVYGRRE